MEEFNDTPAGRRSYLETLLRQQHTWVELPGGSNADLIAKRRAKIPVLMAEISVTDAAQFLREQEAARGGA